MQLKFSPTQTEWLHRTVNQLITVAGHRPDAQALARLAARMRYKFHGSPAVVFLNGKERELVREVAIHRAELLLSSLTEERQTVRQILEILNGYSAAQTHTRES